MQFLCVIPVYGISLCDPLCILFLCVFPVYVISLCPISHPPCMLFLCLIPVYPFSLCDSLCILFLCVIPCGMLFLCVIPCLGAVIYDCCPSCQRTKLVSTLKKFYGRHHLVDPYYVAVSRIIHDVFATDKP